jgi:hypothetical protein
MSTVTVHQALYGYSRGHRQLSSSLQIEAEAGRILRVATDMSFEGHSGSYLSVFPLASLKKQAFVRTWPAGSWMRPGSVWSHVLLLEWSDLARIENFRDVLDLNKPRNLRNDQDAERFAYECSRELGLTIAPRSAPGDASKNVIDPAVLVSAVYSSSRPVTVTSASPEHEENLLLELYAQQWPRLRRSFAFRTRYRSSETAVRYDVEVVEKGDRAGANIVVRDWSGPLAEDLIGRHPALRRFLHTYGAESRRGRRDMSVLARVFESIGYGDARGAVATLFAEFPLPTQMRRLKADFFSETGRIDLPEPERLALAITFSEHLDLGELELGQRFVRLVLSGAAPANVIDREGDSELAAIPESQIDSVLAAIADHLDDQTVVHFASIHEDLGLLVIARRPEFLTNPDVWQALEGESVGDVFASLDASKRNQILEALLISGSIEALSLACTASPEAWWRLVDFVSRSASSVKQIIARARILRETLQRIGLASLSGKVSRGASPRYALTVLLSAPLQAGLWRRVNARDWLQALGSSESGELRGIPPYVQERLLAVGLVASIQGGEIPLRKQGWRITFPLLHEALRSENFDTEAWGVLGAALPSGPTWDRCYRLRRGAVSEIRRDEWGAASTGELIRGAGRQASDMAEQLTRRKNARKSWVSDLLSILGFH